MVILLVDEYCVTNETVDEAGDNIGFPLAGCKFRARLRISTEGIDVLSVTFVGLVITTKAKTESLVQIRICHQFTPVFRQCWLFTIDHCEAIGGYPLESRFYAALSDLMTKIAEITLHSSDRHSWPDRR